MFKRNYILPEDYISATEFSVQVQKMKLQPEYNPKYILKCDAGEYATDSILHLVWEIFTHRLGHFLKGEGFRD